MRNKNCKLSITEERLFLGNHTVSTSTIICQNRSEALARIRLDVKSMEKVYNENDWKTTRIVDEEDFVVLVGRDLSESGVYCKRMVWFTYTIA